MGCQHYFVEEERFNVLGGALTEQMHICRVKRASEELKTRVYQALFDKGLEGSFPGDNCPVAPNNMWQKCPFREE